MSDNVIRLPRRKRDRREQELIARLRATKWFTPELEALAVETRRKGRRHNIAGDEIVKAIPDAA